MNSSTMSYVACSTDLCALCATVRPRKSSATKERRMQSVCAPALNYTNFPSLVVLRLLLPGGALQVWRLGDGSGAIDRDPGEAPRGAGAPKSAKEEKEERDQPRMWLQDSMATVCMNDACKLPFTLTRRKTHCRHCGRIFCAKVR